MQQPPNTKMCGIYKFKNNQPTVWFDRKLSKSNQYCLYCGTFVGEGAKIASNKEHLIGREFVPSGSFDGGTKFNFIFRACTKCNSEKSAIERHISSITLFTSPARNDSHHYNEVAKRKASKDYHPDKKGVLVEDASDNHKINLNSNSNVQLSFNLVTPPQPNIENLKLLAFRHIQGVFSLLTSKNPLEARKTNLLSGQYFYFFGAYNVNDWGNPQVIEATRRAKKYPCYANIDTADGFFKVIMRREEGKCGEWFWALEWNKSFRVFGGIFDPKKTPRAFLNLPQIQWHFHKDKNNAPCKFREEVPLNEKEDILFQS